MLGEIEIVTDDGGDRRLTGLLDIARRHQRQQPLLGFRRTDEVHPHRAAIGAGRALLGEIDRAVQQLVRNRLRAVQALKERASSSSCFSACSPMA